MKSPETPERSEREIFFAAIAISAPAEREEYLIRACDQDSALRARLRRLVASHSLDDAFMAKPVAEVEGFEPTTTGPGSIIGSYRLIEKIGEGGMGIVYLAEQERTLRRRVALKIIKPGMDTRAVVARFEAERQALALMDHPNIARVLDGGATESGRPFFVMEWVQGLPITAYCGGNPMPIADRLRLFVEVSQAVQHAHQKGIIHRDLKPSNVLVTSQNGVPVPKVIDFGVAKATHQQLTEKTLFTGLGTMIGTPAYLSPEQAEMTGIDVDTRSDIYSLGVLLYELLTGTQPIAEQRLRTAGYAELQRIIRDEEPERPSTRLRRAAMPGQGHPLVPTDVGTLDSDLDWIVMKCLEKDRRRRYQTAADLAADLQRHLDDKPVSARPPSVVYQFQKMVRRHRVVSTAIALVAVTLLVGVVVSSWALVRERAARHREQFAFEQANQRLRAALGFVDRVVTNVAPEIRMVPGAPKAQNALLEASLEFAKQLRESAAGDPTARVSLARLLLYMSERQNPGEPNTAGDYQSGVERARDALRLLEGDIPQLGEAERLQLLWHGHFAIVQCLTGLGDWNEALRRSRELDPLLDQMERLPALARTSRRHRMMIRSDRGLVEILAGRPEEALRQHLLPLLNSEWVKHVTESSPDGELLVVMIAHDNAGNACFLTKRFDEMVKHAGESLRMAELLGERNPSNAFYIYVSAQCRAWHGLALLRTGNSSAGSEALGRARGEIEARADQDASSEAFRKNRMIITAIQALAFAGWAANETDSIAERRQRLEEAEKHLVEAERFAGAVKSASAALSAARVEVPKARGELESDERRGNRH